MEGLMDVQEFRWNLKRLIREGYHDGIPLHDLTGLYRHWLGKTVEPNSIITGANNWKDVFSENPILNQTFVIVKKDHVQQVKIRGGNETAVEELADVLSLTSYTNYVMFRAMRNIPLESVKLNTQPTNDDGGGGHNMDIPTPLPDSTSQSRQYQTCTASTSQNLIINNNLVPSSINNDGEESTMLVLPSPDDFKGQSITRKKLSTTLKDIVDQKDVEISVPIPSNKSTGNIVSEDLPDAYDFLLNSKKNSRIQKHNISVNESKNKLNPEIHSLTDSCILEQSTLPPITKLEPDIHIDSYPVWNVPEDPESDVIDISQDLDDTNESEIDPLDLNNSTVPVSVNTSENVGPVLKAEPVRSNENIEHDLMNIVQRWIDPVSGNIKQEHIIELEPLQLQPGITTPQQAKTSTIEINEHPPLDSGVIIKEEPEPLPMTSELINTKENEQQIPIPDEVNNIEIKIEDNLNDTEIELQPSSSRRSLRTKTKIVIEKRPSYAPVKSNVTKKIKLTNNDVVVGSPGIRTRNISIVDTQQVESSIIEFLKASTTSTDFQRIGNTQFETITASINQSFPAIDPGLIKINIDECMTNPYEWVVVPVSDTEDTNVDNIGQRRGFYKSDGGRMTYFTGKDGWLPCTIKTFQLPSKTIVYGEFVEQFNSRNVTFDVIDCACLFGNDIRCLSFHQRRAAFSIFVESNLNSNTDNPKTRIRIKTSYEMTKMNEMIFSNLVEKYVGRSNETIHCLPDSEVQTDFNSVVGILFFQAIFYSSATDFTFAMDNRYYWEFVSDLSFCKTNILYADAECGSTIMLWNFLDIINKTSASTNDSKQNNHNS